MFAPLIEKVSARRDLTEEESAGAMNEVMHGRATPAALAGLLIALRIKGEQPAEIVGLARTMRRHAVALPGERREVFDTCGTGGDASGSFNVSSAVAVVVASCGVRVAKHGNRAVSSHCGSADVFEALGVQVSAPPEIVGRCLDEGGLAFFFAQTFHPSMRHAAPTRKDLGVRTAFNLLGPLTNPAGARRQLVGVPRPELTELVARALARLGSEHAWVVHGSDGLDEISTTGYTKISECRGGLLRTFYLHPSDLGLRKASRADLAGGDASTNAGIVRNLLGGSRGAARDIVLLNAAAALLVAGHVTSLQDGLHRAGDAIDRGDARRTLERLIALSRGEAAA